MLYCLISCDAKYNYLLKQQIDMLTPEIKKILKSQKVIIIDDLLFIDIIKINGENISKVIIYKDIIPDPEKRFLIAHLIRNVLIHNNIIYNYNEQNDDLVLIPVIEVDDEFIRNNKKEICNVIYYLLHKDYFDFYSKSGGSGEKIFISPLLSSIHDDVEQIKTKLLDENGIILIHCIDD